jgi:hypothetical protein
MRIPVAICVVALAACKPGGDRNKEHESTATTADTLVTRRQVEDTTVVRTDTTIRTDTTVKKDTIRKSGSRPPSETTRTGTKGARADTTTGRTDTTGQNR